MPFLAVAARRPDRAATSGVLPHVAWARIDRYTEPVARRSTARSAARKHDHDRCIESALAEAEELCRERDVKLTDLRRRALELVWSAHRAVKAYDLLERLGEDGKPVKPTTAYRALDFLLEQGLIHRIESLNAFVGCASPATSHDSELLVCEACGLVEEVTVPELGRALARGAASVDFEATRSVVELRGRCARCRRLAVA
jgi:Fur family transcriptional regulator, zinc uptake regulator